MKLHWQIAIALIAGIGGGVLFQLQTDEVPWIGARVAPHGDGVRVVSLVPDGPAAKALAVGDRIMSVSRRRGDEEGTASLPVRDAAELDRAVGRTPIGEILWVDVEGRREAAAVAVALDPSSTRAEGLRWFGLVADVLMSLLKMLIVPLVLTSIVTGVAGVGSGRDLGRLGIKTFAYYVTTSLAAATVGLLLVNAIQPGRGASLGLPPTDSFEKVAGQDFTDILRRMVPTNVFEAFSDNGQMLQVIVFAILLGIFITRAAAPHGERMRGLFESGFEVMMKMAGFVLATVPVLVFCLLVKVVGSTGFGLLEPLALYMVTIVAGLLVHALITLPAILSLVGRVNPLGWAKAMSPALLTAFSTSSSSLTLPVSLDSVEHRGKVSNRTTSFVLPLGATINMDGTALYECVGVIFLAQYYEGVSGFELGWDKQVLVVFMALLASIGAAGIPSAGLVMMLTILGVLGLPVEGAALLLAVDRPLDMLRTSVNVWSDSTGAALIARTEGERPLVDEGLVLDTG